MMALRFLFAVAVLLVVPARANDPATPRGAVKIDLQFQGGHETDPRDCGRPVVLIAAALGVSPDTFREAFSHVHPAPAGQQPRAEDVRQNKRELLSCLAHYGVTNERLDDVSNYYRYRRESGELWRHADAAGYALVQNGKIVSINLTNGGAGYTNPPRVSIPGISALKVYPCARLSLSTDLAKNGSIAKIELSAIGDGQQPVGN